MTHEQFKKSIEKKELQLSFWGTFTHYGIVAFLLFISLFFILSQVRDYLRNEMYILRSEVFLFVVCPVLLSILSYFIQKQKLKLIVIDSSLNSKEVSAIFNEVASEQEWNLSQHTSNILIANTPYSFKSGSWGEQVTLLLFKNQIFLNSICDPAKMSSVVSYGRNKKNQLLLLNKLRIES
jgi:hypothetical protein